MLAGCNTRLGFFFDCLDKGREQRMRAILEGAVDAIVTIDVQGRIESANSATELSEQPISSGNRVAESSTSLRSPSAETTFSTAATATP